MKWLYTVLYILIVGQIFFFLGLLLPRERFCEDKFPYKLLPFENGGRIYNKIHIKKWKTKVPDMSIFSKKLLTKRISEVTSDSMDKLIKESCVAEAVHYALCVCSVGIYEIWESGVGVLLGVLYILGNFVFVFIQRYNRPNMISLRDKLKLREERRLSEVKNG